MKRDVEHRNYTTSLVTSEGEGMVLRGTIPYERESLWLGFTEILKRGCFKKSVSESRDLKFLEEHDEKKLRARGKNGSFIVTEDEEGVHFEATLCDTQENRDLYTKVKTGLLSNVSFGFSVIKDRKVGQLREVLEARLYEISAVGSPAYESTTLFCRSLSEFYEGKEINEEDKKSILDEIERLNSLVSAEDNKSEPTTEVPNKEPSSEVSEPQSELDTPKEEPKEEDHYLEEVSKRLDSLESLLNSLEEELK